jgi:hypothetical protein
MHVLAVGQRLRIRPTEHRRRSRGDLHEDREATRWYAIEGMVYILGGCPAHLPMFIPTPLYYTSLRSVYQPPIPDSIQPQHFPTMLFKASTVLALLFACTAIAVDIDIPLLDRCLVADEFRACKFCRYSDIELKSVCSVGKCVTDYYEGPYGNPVS